MPLRSRLDASAHAWRTYEVGGLLANAVYQLLEVVAVYGGAAAWWSPGPHQDPFSGWLLTTLGLHGWVTSKVVAALLLVLAVRLTSGSPGSAGGVTQASPP